jgi:hypothetical protein
MYEESRHTADMNKCLKTSHVWSPEVTLLGLPLARFLLIALGNFLLCNKMHSFRDNLS